MERLGTDLLLVCSSVDPQSVADDALAAEQLRLLAERAERHGVRIAYGALAWGRHVNTYEHAWRIVDSADHRALGTCLDSFHILSRGGDPAGIAQLPGEKIFFLQLADAPLMAMDVLQWSRHYRCFPGQGGLDVAGVAAAAVRAGYQGPLSLEVFNDVFRQGEAARTAVDALRSLLLLEESAGLAAPDAVPAAAPPSGFAYAELAAADTEPLRGLLRALGFGRTALAARAEEWVRGRARIRLNSPGAGRRSVPVPLPHQYDGPALSGIGLAGPDPDAAARRAATLLAPVASSGALDTVVAPDGTRLSFCSDGKPVEPSAPFSSSEEPSGGTGITHIDHVALTQPWHQFDEACLFHRSVLGLAADPGLELADPYGLLRSRAFAGPGGGVRIVLNVTPGPSDETARSQHIALATDDIVATARAVRERGGELLPIPANYYDDLAARHDLDPATLAVLRDLGILYDRDGRGEFWHCYTATVGRVFFELVQRTGGYRGYGAGNAPVRLAAQHARRHGRLPGP